MDLDISLDRLRHFSTFWQKRHDPDISQLLDISVMSRNVEDVENNVGVKPGKDLRKRLNLSIIYLCFQSFIRLKKICVCKISWSAFSNFRRAKFLFLKGRLPKWPTGQSPVRRHIYWMNVRIFCFFFLNALCLYF